MPDVYYSIQELADLADVSRRTVRYYVQEGLLQAPLGVGRGRHYGREHLDRLLEVKGMQAAGRSLDDIRAVLAARARSAQHAEGTVHRPQAALKGGAGHPRATGPSSLNADTITRTLWRRLELAPGIELHVASRVSLPGPARLQELAEWCRTYFAVRSSDEDENAG